MQSERKVRTGNSLALPTEITRAIVIAVALLVPRSAWSTVEGNRHAQEKGDILWRNIAPQVNTYFGNLQKVIENHSAIYDRVYASRADQSSRWAHDAMEMDGGVLTRHLALETFVLDGHGEDNYFGAYTASALLDFDTRWAIVQKAETLLTEDILYAVDFPFGIDAPRLSSSYIFYNSTGANGLLDDGEITRMRSDAFTEYIYTKNGVPLVTVWDVDVVHGPNLFQLLAGLGGLLPSQQRAKMSLSTIESPTITVFTSTNGPVANQSVTSASSIKIKVDDKSSGPGRLEVRRTGESQPFATFGNFEALQTTTYIFTPLEEGAALGGPGTLGAGQYSVSAWDQAGNVSSMSFTVASIPLLHIHDAQSKVLYNDFQGISASTPTAIGGYLTISATDTVASITRLKVTHDSYVILDYTLNPPTASTTAVLGSLAQGNYSVVAENLHGGFSSATLKVGSLAVVAYSTGTQVRLDGSTPYARVYACVSGGGLTRA